MNSATTTKLIVSTAIIVTVLLSSTTPIQKASAQMMAQPPAGMMNPGMMMRNQNFTGMMMMAAAPNVTGSVPIFPTISNAISSQVHTSLVNATMTAEKTVGSNAHAVSSHVGVQNGFLVYTVWVIDSGNNIHRVIVDVGNGKVLSSQQLPTGPGMMMMHMMMHGGGMMMGPMMGGFRP